MNTGFFCHISEETLETYALGRAVDAHRAPLEEHLLVCPACRLRLEDLEEYIEVMKAATARVSCGVS
jgi:anti-sigma factor RsiW